MPSSPPDWLNAHGDATPVIDPESHVREYAKRRGRDPNDNCPPLVIGGFIDLMIDPMAEAVGAVESEDSPWLAAVHKAIDAGQGRHPGDNRFDAAPRTCASANWTATPIGVARIPVGGARSAMTLEELMALGARTFLIAGATGALKPGIQVGDYVIANKRPARRGHSPTTTSRRSTRHEPTDRRHEG